MALAKITKDHINRTAYASFDPGHNTGVTLWNKEGKTVIITEVKGVEELNNLLNLLKESTEIKEFVIEEYRVYGQVNHTGSTLPTVQTIGRIKKTAEDLSIPVIELKASVKSIAAQWAQVKIPKGHMPDWMAAYLIGYYHLHWNKKLIKAKVLDKK